MVRIDFWGTERIMAGRGSWEEEGFQEARKLEKI
jgi:hypothetical protein